MTDFPNDTKGRLGFGCMRLPMAGGSFDRDAVCSMFDAFLGAGFNYFDTAHVYLGGRSEAALRECLVKRHPRGSFLIADKLSTQNFRREEDIDPLLESELKALGVDYLDVLLMHAQNAAHYDKYTRTRAYEHAAAFKAAGKARAVGVSFHDSPEVLARILGDHPELDVVQLQLNWQDWESATVQARRCYELCKARGIPVVVMEPLKGGNLVNLPEAAQTELDAMPNPEGLSGAGVALRFAASWPGVAVVLSGMSSLEDVRDNASAMASDAPLSPEQMACLARASEAIAGLGIIECTACHYCTDGCPKRIQIPEMFDCLNTVRVFGGWNPGWYYSNSLAAGGHAPASACVGCGKCERACPQYLPIRELLAEVAAEFE